MNIKLGTLLVLLILILSVGMVSATENVSMDANVNNGNEYLSTGLNDVEIVSDSTDTGSFTDLYTDINKGTTIVNLNKNYKYDSSGDKDFVNGIEIKDIVINGNNHTIDGSNLARIFSQASGTVILNDVKIINGYVPNNKNGGAYLLSSGNLTVNNCKFENNSAGKHGGAIGVESISDATSIKIKDSSFINNSAKFNGGSIYCKDLDVDNSCFDSNKILARSSTESQTLAQKALGGAICSEDIMINNSVFKNNKVLNSGYYQIEEGGGAVTSLKRITVDNSDFSNNTAHKGGAIFAVAAANSNVNSDNYVKIANSNFSDNVAQSGGAVCTNFNISVDNSAFDHNTANGYGGGAINTGYGCNDNSFTNSNFTNNVAYNYGGAISSSHSQVDNCLFDNNEANHGGAIFSYCLDIADSEFKDNVGKLGNETLIVVDAFTKDGKTEISDDEILLLNDNKIENYVRDVLDGSPAVYKLITSGPYEGYEVYCIEQHLFYPSSTEGVMVKDLTYLSNSRNRELVGDYVRILFALRDLYPERYSSYSIEEVQDLVWIFTDGNYNSSEDKLVKDVLSEYANPTIVFTNTIFMLKGDLDSLREYDMQIFLTPVNMQNMVLFKSQPLNATFNETVEKDTLNETVLVGEDVEFRITVTNNGIVPLDDVFISDIEYSNGLTYKSWCADVGNWTYNDNGKWVLDYTLKPEEKASIIVKFATSVVGVLTNNVTSGCGNITLSNSTNKTTTFAKPKLSVEKISNNEKVYPGEEVSFDIVVKNVGEHDCTGVYIVDNKYSKGLVYDYYVDPTNLWTYEGNNRWDYHKVLKPGESTTIILFFLVETKEPGLLNNTVFAGNNITDDIENSTNHTRVILKNDTFDDNDTNDTNKTVEKHHKSRIDRNATGNPLYALILVLITLGVISPKRKK